MKPTQPSSTGTAWGDLVCRLKAALADVPAGSLPECFGDLEQLRVLALARLLAPIPAPQADELLSAAEAARRLNVPKQFLYRSKDLPFRREISPGRIRFSAQGTASYIAGDKTG